MAIVEVRSSGGEKEVHLARKDRGRTAERRDAADLCRKKKGNRSIGTSAEESKKQIAFRERYKGYEETGLGARAELSRGGGRYNIFSLGSDAGSPPNLEK